MLQIRKKGLNLSTVSKDLDASLASTATSSSNYNQGHRQEPPAR